MNFLPLLLLAAAPVQDTATISPAALASYTADAYHDSTAYELVQGVRARTAKAERNIDEYRVLVKEQISAGMRALRRDRMLYRRETAARIHWMRDDTVRIDVLGAREVIPIAVPKPQIPSALRSFVHHLAFSPGDDRLLILAQGSDDIRSPTRVGGEADYRFRTGGRTSLTLPDGRQIQLRELQFIPRRRDYRLVTGSFWIDESSHAIVQAVFKMARPFELQRDGEEDEDEDIPGFIPTVRASLEYVTVEYNLVEFRWWLPRMIALEGIFEFGSVARVPLRYELSYNDYQVTGDTLAAPRPPVQLAEGAESARCPTSFSIQISTDDDDDDDDEDAAPIDSAGADSIAQAEWEALPDSVKDLRTRQRKACERYVVTLPADSTTLLTSAELGDSPFDMGETLISEAELRALADKIGAIPEAPWDFARPTFRWGLGNGLTRYNRVEGLAVGAAVEADVGPFTGDALLRIGIADREPSFELGARRRSIGSSHRLALFRRLESMDQQARPFTFASSFNALVFGRDETDYYRTLGAELIRTPAPTRSQWYRLRLYGQAERAADKETDFAVRSLWEDDFAFLPNRKAARAEQVGAELALTYETTPDPNRIRFGAELYGHGSTGTFDYVKPAITMRAAVPLTASLTAAVEGATGASYGFADTDSMAPQHLWYLGGPSTLRGYRGSVVSGEAFWRARAELGWGLPFARVVLFSDAGRADRRQDVYRGTPLLSAGVGASVLDGLLRLDLARALRDPKGWRLQLHIDAPL